MFCPRCMLYSVAAATAAAETPDSAPLGDKGDGEVGAALAATEAAAEEEA